ncbi:hypothetical protein UFOVP245_81 [uncultured Caudovirales phage]|uniref:Uncharacterized protein n=1 Tax=uncultured Caudovirales phage TaxID=2100421 RepID=A0A6J7X1I6_9CAUD|nr:hypothetical protein UFOVP245_81 [uncultured Caudovirales phage]
MDNVNNIIMSAWEKDAVNLKGLIDAEMSARAEEQIASMTADVAASMFGATVGDESEEYEDSESTEGQTDDDI